MPADYSSTARALSLPVEERPERSPSPTFLRPPWNPRRSTSNAGNRSDRSIHNSGSFRDNLVDTVGKVQHLAFKTYKRLTPLQRVLGAIAMVVSLILLILFLRFNESIFGWLEPIAVKWKRTTGGWTILWLIVFITAFPPVIGYGACGTVAGFVYGILEGWLILATASVAGSFCSLILSRTLLKKYVERIVANDKRFAALTLTLKHDGLKLLCMIRLCPLPYSLSNGAMSTFPTVHPAMYALATAIVSPKLLVHAFIGSRLAAIAKSGGEMSAGAKAINWISIILGGIVGACTGYYIYQRTMARARQLEAEERDAVRESVHQRGDPPPEFTDDPETRTAVSTLAKDGDDAPDYFDDDASSPRSDDNAYKDGFTSDEDADVFDGDGDEEEAIGLHEARKNNPTIRTTNSRGPDYGTL